MKRMLALALVLSAAFCARAFAEPEAEAAPPLRIADVPVTVEWEESETVEALFALCAEGPLEIQMSQYGGFEQVGALGERLPRDDQQTTTQPGDIVLYAGDQLVVFYGSNSWAYTRLGRIVEPSVDDLAQLLEGGDVVVVLGAE